MKKLFSLLLAFSMAVTFAACGNTEQADQATTEQQTEASDSQPVPGALDAVLDGVISYSDYDIETDEDFTWFFMKDHTPTEMDFTIQLDNGDTIVLPVVYSDFLQAGWVSDRTWADPFDGNSTGYGNYTNADGDNVHVSIVNPFDEARSLNDIYVNTIEVGNDNYDGFEIHGIRKGSTVLSVINTWGNPYKISYNSSDSSLQFIYQAEDLSTLTFTFDVNDGTVSGAKYNYVYLSITE